MRNVVETARKHRNHSGRHTHRKRERNMSSSDLLHPLNQRARPLSYQKMFLSTHTHASIILRRGFSFLIVFLCTF